MSAANDYKKKLGHEIEELFNGEFKFYSSKLELKRKRKNGFDVIVLSGSNKWSPYIDVSFYFGRNFDSVRKVEKVLGDHPMPYHIQQYSLNVLKMEGLEYRGKGTWEVNIEEPSKDVAKTIRHSIEIIAFPFFERFSNLKDAQKALSSDDSWCFSPRGPFYHMLFKVDAALNDLDHFEKWTECLDDFFLQQAKEDIEKLEANSNEI